MTIESQYAPAIFQGNGSALIFPFLWRCFETQWIRATITTNGSDTDLVQDVDYSVTLLQDTNGGSITLSAPLPTGVQLTLWMQVPITQENAYQNSGTLNVKTLETAYDKLTLIAQQQQNAIDRAVKVGVTETQKPEEIISSIYAARDAAADSASAAAVSAGKSAVSAAQSLGSAAEALASAMRACACADRSEQARDVVLEQVALVNQLMAVEMGKINTLIAANKDDHLAAIAQALAWAITPHNVPVRMHPETNEPEFSALHWAEVARRAGLEEATMLKFGIVRLASALDVVQGHPTAVVTAVQLKERTSPATEEEFGVVRLATAADFTSGVTVDNGSAVVTVDALFEAFINNRICQYEWFEDDMPRAGFFSCLGGVVTNFAAKYPKAAAYFETAYGQKRLVTQAQYDALHVYVWHTNADGTKIGWNGIGGVTKFVWDKEKDTLRLPDLAGMTPEQVGYDSLGVGDVHGDGIRNFAGKLSRVSTLTGSPTGPFFIAAPNSTKYTLNGSGDTADFEFNPGRVVPVANKNQPRAWGSLACVYLGMPK